MAWSPFTNRKLIGSIASSLCSVNSATDTTRQLDGVNLEGLSSDKFDAVLEIDGESDAAGDAAHTAAA